MPNVRFQVVFMIGFMAMAGVHHKASATTVAPNINHQTKASKPAKPLKTSKSSEIISGSWQLGCKPFGADNKLLCEVSRSVALKKTGKVLLSLFVTPWKQAKATAPYILRLQLPHGLNLPAGVQIQIDDGKQHDVTYQTTNQNGVFARIGLSGKILPLLQKGKNLNVRFSAINDSTITIPVPLSGFSAVFAKIN